MRENRSGTLPSSFPSTLNSQLLTDVFGFEALTQQSTHHLNYEHDTVGQGIAVSRIASERGRLSHAEPLGMPDPLESWPALASKHSPPRARHVLPFLAGAITASRDRRRSRMFIPSPVRPSDRFRRTWRMVSAMIQQPWLKPSAWWTMPERQAVLSRTPLATRTGRFMTSITRLIASQPRSKPRALCLSGSL